MKKRILTLLCVLVTCLSSSSAMNDGDTFWADNLKYTIISEVEKTVRLDGPDRDNITSLTVGPCYYRGMKYYVESLAAHAFENCKYLRTVTIDCNIETIPDYAFAGCTSLTSIDLSSKVVGKYAFAGCISLNKVSMYGIMNVDDYAFYKCTNLQKCDMYYTLKRIGKYAFAEDMSIEGNLYFPSGLASIGEGAYKNCTRIRGVDLGNTMITKIEPYSFSNCPGIGLLNLPDNVTEIGEYAFDQNSFLTTIELPCNLKVIGEGAFKDSEYRSITIPASVDSIGSLAFCSCSNLSSLTFLGETIKYIGGYAFNYTGVKSITLPTGVEYLGWLFVPSGCKVYAQTVNNKIPESAYKNCLGMEYITIPEATTEIGKEAFSGCKNLHSVTFEGDKVKNIRSKAFYGCQDLRSVIMPSALSSMGTSVFEGCKYLSSVTFKGDNLTTIPTKAFKECASIRSIIIPSRIKNIGSDSFDGCIRLKTVTINGQNLKTISTNAFRNTTSLTSINLPASLESITYNAFDSSACRKDTCGAVYFDQYMHSVHKSDNPRWITVLESTRVIGPNAFEKLNNNLVRVTIPASVENICDNAFKNCEELEEVRIKPNSLLKSIGNSAFENCPKMTMTIPSGVTSVGKYAFANCARFEVKFIPAGISEVPEGAFMGCKIAASNADFKIPANIIKIAKKAFAGNEGARILSVNANCTNIDGSAFEGWGQFLDSIYVAPDNSRYGYPIQYNAVIDKVSKAIILTCKNCKEIPDGITKIGDYAFAGRTFTKFDIPGSITSIGSHAFEGCKNLTTVSFLGNKVNSIYKYAFANCPKLKNMSIPSKVHYCYEGVFMGCESLDISIPSNINYIGKKAFMGSGIKKLVIPNTVYQIQDSAFCDCKQMQSVRFNGFSVDYGIGTYTFAGCTALKEAYLPRYEEMINKGMFAYCRNLTTVESENVSEIQDLAFRNCSNLKDMNFQNIRYVGKYSFQNCRALQSLDLSDAFESIATAAFSGCSGLQTVTLPNSIDSIGKFAFEYCTSLSQINIPENMTKIPNGIFRGCSSLSIVELPSGTQRIGDYAFMSCTNLTNVTVNNDEPLTIGRYAFNGCERLNGIPTNVATIADYAFAGCNGMTSMILNATIDSIGSCAFAGCTALTSIHNERVMPLTISPSVFKGITQSNVTLYVPLINAYKRASVWKNFKVMPDRSKTPIIIDRAIAYDEKKIGEISEFVTSPKKMESVTSVEELQNSLDKDVIIYDLKGQKVKDVVPGQVYIINGQKIYIK